LHVTRGHELFHERKYSEAIREYKHAQSLIAKILFPKIPDVMVWNPSFVYPTVYDPNVFKATLSIGLDLVEAINPRSVATEVGAPFVNVKEDYIKDLKVYENVGVNIANENIRSATYNSQLGSYYAERGQWSRATYFYRNAQNDLKNNNDNSEIDAARAAIELNLASVYIQENNLKSATTLINKANKIYQANNDLVGQAQVKINEAAIFIKRGNQKKAEKNLEQAENLINQAQGLITEKSQRKNLEITPRINIPLITNQLLSVFETSAPATLRASDSLSRFDTKFTTRELASTIKPSTLNNLVAQKGFAVSLRQPAKGGGWSGLSLETVAETNEKQVEKQLGVLFGNEVVNFQWTEGQLIKPNQVIDRLYKARVDSGSLKVAKWDYVIASDFSVQLPHLYYFKIPVALGDCYNAIGDFQRAQEYYLNAANYQYINTSIEVPALWLKIAENILEWGDEQYKDDYFTEATNIYRVLLEMPGATSVVDSNSPLYLHDKLKILGNKVKTFLQDIEQDSSALGLNPNLVIVLLTVRARLTQLAANLDFLGMGNIVPIWTFDYLQNITRYFANQAKQAERDYINFIDKGENESFTREQLRQGVIIANAEEELAKRQKAAADQEVQVYEEGKELARIRRENAQNNRNNYSAMSRERIWLSEANAWYSSQNPWTRENRIVGEGPDAGRYVYEVIAENTRRLQIITRDYELAAMQRQITELQQGEDFAQAQVNAAKARQSAAQQMETVARLRRQAAQQYLQSFDNQVFTPDVWYDLGYRMRSISRAYLYMATRIARLMQRAYNFENDVNRRVIKTSYTTNTIKGLLGADNLLLDINSFVFDEIVATKSKNIPTKYTLSLAQRFPFQFETQFKRTGTMNFETRIEDFDFYHPGTYGRRIERIEVEVEGFLPRGGIRGILTNSGLSRYRTPDINVVKFRFQPKESLILSEYQIRQDTIIFQSDQRKLELFEGAGVASSWTLEFPLETNDVDFYTITDVRMHFYYQSKYNDTLASAIKAAINNLPGQNLNSRNIPLRYAFPDAFFYFQDTGELNFELTTVDFQFNQSNPIIRELALLIIHDDGLDPTILNMRVTVPDGTEGAIASPNGQGEISVPNGHPWDTLKGGSAIGNYRVAINPGENPDLMVDGKINIRPINNVILIMEYEYTPRTQNL
jgi:hypothetical protein